MAFGGRLRRSHAADPVFVDRTGRRRRIAAVAGGVAGIVLILTTLTMLVGFTGVGGGHLPGLPGIGGVATGAAQVPGQSPAARAGARPSPSAGHGVPGASTTPIGFPTTTPSPSVSSHRKDPTQTPSHPGKKK
jgi:hypothetical protein